MNSIVLSVRGWIFGRVALLSSSVEHCIKYSLNACAFYSSAEIVLPSIIIAGIDEDCLHNNFFDS